MRKQIIIAAVLVAAATSCQKEMMQEPEYIGNFSIRASREACLDTKASVNTTSGAFTWSKGDAIGIYNGSTFDELKTNNEDGSASATFTGMISGTAQKYAVFPWGVSPALSGDALKVTLPTSYEWKKDEANTTMLADYVDGKPLEFKHLGGIVKVTVNNISATATQFVLTTDKDITGEYTVSEVNGVKQITSAGATDKNQVTINFTAGTAANMDFYVPVPVGSYKFSIKLLDAAGAEIIAKNGGTSNEVARATFLRMPALTCISVSGGGETTTTSVGILASHNGTFYLPDTNADVEVNFTGDGLEDVSSQKITLTYAAGGGSKPATVTVNAGTYKFGDLELNLPESHVNMVGGTYNNLTSKTSVSTLVLGSSTAVSNDLKVIGGSAEIGGTVNSVFVSNDVGEKATIKVAETAQNIRSLNVEGGGKIEIAAPVESVTVTDDVPKTAEIKVAEFKDSNKSIGTLNVAGGGKIEIAAPVATVSVASTVPTNAEIKLASTAKITSSLDVAGGGKVEIEAKEVKAVTIAESVPPAVEINVAKDAKVESLAVTVGNVSVEGKVTNVEVKAATSGASQEAKAATPVIWVTGQVTGTLTNNNANAAVVAESNGSTGSNIAAVAGDYKTVKSPSDFLRDKFTAGGTVTLEQDITGDFTIANAVVLNLNGHKLTGNAGDTFTVNSGGSLTIKGEGEILNNISGKYPINISAGGTLVAEGINLPKVYAGKDDIRYYAATEAAVNAAIADTGINRLVLTSDIALANTAVINGGRKLVIDMNGHCITKGSTPFDIYNATVEFTGTGTIAESIDDSFAALRLRGAASDCADYTVVTIGKDITLKGWSGIAVSYDAGGTNSFNNYGLKVNFNGKVAHADGFTKDEYGIYINGTNKQTSGNIAEFNLDGASIDAACAGIYAAGYAKWNIKNSTLVGNKETAIEIRAGKMTIESGSYTSNATVFSTKPNGNGNTTAGAALAISQHTTDLDIDVNVTGGTFKGIYAIYENDIQNNTGNVSVSVSGASLNGKVYSKHNESICNPKNVIHVSNETELTSALSGSKDIVLIADIDLKNPVRVARKLTLDLNGKTLKAVANSARTKYDDSVIIVKRGGDLTVTGNGTVTANGLTNVYAAVKLTEYNDTGDAAAKLTVENGDFVGYYYAIVGNGTRHNTEITINGGKFSATAENDNQAIYHPQDGTLNINGGTFSGYASAIELRSGKLNISGGSFTSAATKFSATPNGNGTTIIGAALAISQHTTDKDIDVKVTGGSFKGIYAIYEDDIQNNTGNVSVSVSGATLTGKVYCKHNEALNTSSDGSTSDN